jgi:hypothetical protein
MTFQLAFTVIKPKGACWSTKKSPKERIVMINRMIDGDGKLTPDKFLLLLIHTSVVQSAKGLNISHLATVSGTTEISHWLKYKQNKSLPITVPQ